MSPIVNHWKQFVIAAWVLLCWQMGSHAQEAVPGVKELKAVKQEMVNKYQSVADRLGTLPSKADPNKWDSVASAAKEVGEKVAQLQKARLDLLSITKEEGNSTGTFRARLDQVKGFFLELEKEARREVDGTNGAQPLPQTLLDPIKREAEIYRTTAENCDKLAGRVVAVFARQKDSLAMVDRCGAMLDRLQRASAQYIQLAEAGKQMDEGSRALTSFAAQLNAILDLFGSLNARTSEAISLLDDKSNQATHSTKTVERSNQANTAENVVSSRLARPKAVPAGATLTAVPTVDRLLTRIDQLQQRQSE